MSEKIFLKRLLYSLLVISIISLIIPFFIPKESIEFLNNIPARVFIFVMCEVLLINALLAFYKYFFTPSAKRFLVWVFHTITFMMLVMSFAPSSLLGIESFQLLLPGGVKASLEAAQSNTVEIVRTGFFCLVALGALYVIDEKFELSRN